MIVLLVSLWKVSRMINPFSHCAFARNLMANILVHVSPITFAGTIDSTLTVGEGSYTLRPIIPH